MENAEGKDSVFLISFQCCSDVYAECHDIIKLKLIETGGNSLIYSNTPLTSSLSWVSDVEWERTTIILF